MSKASADYQMTECTGSAFSRRNILGRVAALAGAAFAFTKPAAAAPQTQLPRPSALGLEYMRWHREYELLLGTTGNCEDQEAKAFFDGQWELARQIYAQPLDMTNVMDRLMIARCELDFALNGEGVSDYLHDIGGSPDVQPAAAGVVAAMFTLAGMPLDWDSAA